ncbi:MAG TPA: hypothetical protein VNO35_32810 [Steroidobacteraceae bacterium]|nr:hypothetical protein [Steroidobacteraceae bacterium]
MSISRRIFEVLVAFALQPIVCAQSVLDFDGWMQKIDRRSQSVQRALIRKDVNGATADAREIGELYNSMETYFTRRGNSANAVRLSKEGRDLAATVVESVAANDFAAASQAAVGIAHACRTCHLEYKPLE